MLAGVAGGESAVAIYDAGKLEFLYITEIGSSRFANSAIGRVKQKFQPRKAGGRDYFVQSKGDNTLAFALVDNRLILATREDLIASSLKLLAGEKIGTLREERWFDQTLGKALTPTAAPDIRFLADLDRTAKTPQFRSYWIQSNTAQIRQFSSEIADLRFSAGDVREDRVLLRRDAQESLAAAELAVADVLRYANADAGFSQAMAKPSAVDVAGILAQKLFGYGGSLGRQYQGKAAPNAPEGPSLLGEDDYDTRIDTAQATEDSLDVFAPFTALASNTDALLQTGITRTTSVLPAFDTAIVLHGITAWKAGDVKRALGQVAGALWSVAPGSLEWSDRNGYSELNSVTPLQLAIEANTLVISASPEWMARVIAGRRTPSAQGATYVASFKFAQELPGFTRMMRLIDFPSIPQGQASDGRQPLFFSENIAGFATSLSRLESAVITTRDTGTIVTESVVYRKR